MSIMQTREMKKQQVEDTIVDLIEELVLGREDPDQRASVQRSINDATTAPSKRQKLLALMEKDGTQTKKDMRVLGDIRRLMKTFDPYGTGFSLVKDHLTPLVEHLREYVRVGEVEKKEHGEVMTPIWLVEDMLDKLPEHVWSDPSLKWLDPCNGCGVFPSVVVSRLMAGLQTEFPDQVERYRHIVENMIHVCDIQAKNCFLHMVAFDPKDLFDMNIYCGSFLDEEFDKFAKGVWGVEKFDVVIGNPPYQELKPGNKKSQAIWPKFVERSLDLLEEKGYISMVHPAGWREPKGAYKKIGKKLLDLKIIFLELHNFPDGLKTFGAATSYDWYVAQKNVEKTSAKTWVRFQDGSLKHIQLNGVEFIPNSRMEEIYSLVAKPGEEKTEIIFSRSAYGNDKPHISKEKTGNFIYPVVYTCPGTKETPRFFWSSRNDLGHFNVPKVVWSNGAPKIYIDDSGEFGLTNFAYGIVDEKENLPLIKKAFESKRFISLMKECSLSSSHRYNHKIIALFRKDFWKEFIDV